MNLGGGWLGPLLPQRLTDGGEIHNTLEVRTRIAGSPLRWWGSPEKRTLQVGLET